MTLLTAPPRHEWPRHWASDFDVYRDRLVAHQFQLPTYVHVDGDRLTVCGVQTALQALTVIPIGLTVLEVLHEVPGETVFRVSVADVQLDEHIRYTAARLAAVDRRCRRVINR